jgi:hypothetical protein
MPTPTPRSHSAAGDQPSRGLPAPGTAECGDTQNPVWVIRGSELPAVASQPKVSPTAAVTALGYTGPFTVDSKTGLVVEHRLSVVLARFHVSAVPGGYVVDEAAVTMCVNGPPGLRNRH